MTQANDVARPAAWSLRKGREPYKLMYERDDRGDFYEWEPLYDRAALDAAVAAERERCAKMAEEFANRAWNDARSEAWSDEFELLARNIRTA